MPRRKSPYTDPPPMKPEIKQKFRELVERGKKKKERSWMNPAWQLWRWDTLEDVPQS